MSKYLTVFAIVLMLISGNLFAEDFVGKVLFASGDAKVMRADGSQQALQRRDGILNSDHLITGNGVLQIKFNDGGFMSLQKHSEMKVEKYHYEGSENGKESAIFSLLRGGLRALSGAIGHKRPGRYQLRTAVATIGIRGTAYSALLCQQDCGEFNGQDLADGLHAKTTEGTIFVENEGGILDIPAGKAAFVPDSVTLPTYTEFNPSFAAIEPRSQLKSKTKIQASAKQKVEAKLAGTKSPSTEQVQGIAEQAKSITPSSRGLTTSTRALSNVEIASFDRFVNKSNSFMPAEAGAIDVAPERNISQIELTKQELTRPAGIALNGGPVDSIVRSAPGITPAISLGASGSLTRTPSFTPVVQPMTIAPSVSESVTEVLSNTNGLTLESGLNQLNVNSPINNNYSIPGNLINNPFNH